MTEVRNFETCICGTDAEMTRWCPLHPYGHTLAGVETLTRKSIWQRLMNWIAPPKPRAPDLRDVNPATFYTTMGGQRRDGRWLARNLHSLAERAKPLPVVKVSPDHMEEIIGAPQ